MTVFISYRHVDPDQCLADELYRGLVARGHEVFIDRRIWIGTEWAREIQHKTARVWDARSGKPLVEPLRHEAAVSAVAFSPEGDRVLTGSADNTARVWDARSGKPLVEPLRHEDWVRAVAFSLDGSTVYTATDRWLRRFELGRDPPALIPRSSHLLSGTWTGGIHFLQPDGGTVPRPTRCGSRRSTSTTPTPRRSPGTRGHSSPTGSRSWPLRSVRTAALSRPIRSRPPSERHRQHRKTFECNRNDRVSMAFPARSRSRVRGRGRACDGGRPPRTPSRPPSRRPARLTKRSPLQARVECIIV